MRRFRVYKRVYSHYYKSWK